MFLRTASPWNSLPATSMPSCLLLSPPRSPPGILEKVGGSGNSPAPSPFEGKPGSRHFGHDPRRGNPSVRRYDAARWPGRTARVAILPLKNPGGIREWESHSRMRPPFAIGRGIRAWASLRHSPSECPEASRMPIRLRKGKSAFAQAELHSAGTSRPPGWSTPIREWTPPKRAPWAQPAVQELPGGVRTSMRGPGRGPHRPYRGGTEDRRVGHGQRAHARCQQQCDKGPHPLCASSRSPSQWQMSARCVRLGNGATTSSELWPPRGHPLRFLSPARVRKGGGGEFDSACSRNRIHRAPLGGRVNTSEGGL